MSSILYSWTCQHTLVRKGRRMRGTHRHMHAHVERASEANPSSNQQHEHVLVGRGRGDFVCRDRAAASLRCYFLRRSKIQNGTVERAGKTMPVLCPGRGSRRPWPVHLSKKKLLSKLKSSISAVFLLFHSHIVLLRLVR